MTNTREEIESWLKEMSITDYVINEDLTVDIDGSVDISYKKLQKIPINFGKINGNFYCNDNNLTSLEYCPKEVNGYFSCNDNNLTSLEYCPKEVKGDFYCYNNKLISLINCPEVIDGSFDCSNNKLTSLEGCPEVISGNFYCYHNKLTNLGYFPKEVNGNGIYVTKNNIKEEELVNFNCNIEKVINIYSDFNKKGNKEEFLEKVRFYKNIKRENELLTEINKNSNNIKLSKKL